MPRPVVECPRKSGAWAVERVTAPFTYAYPLSHYLQALKFKHGRRLGRALGLLLAEAVGNDSLRGAVLVAVPLHRRRLRERGYNQALEIMRTLAGVLGLDAALTGIERIGAAVPQSTLGAAARRRNIRDAFRIRTDLSGKHMVVVDDVVTTGATVNALAAALQRAGARRVDAIAVARTLPAHVPPRH